MQRIITAFMLCLILATGMPALAQGPGDKRPDRKEWFRQMREYKHDFMAKELCLSKEQQGKFFPLYDDMEQKLHRIQHESMEMENKINRSQSGVTDLEYEKAAEALVEVKGKEAAIEEQYFAKFKSVLTPKQLFKLKQAERNFTRELMKQHSRMKEKHPRN
ncbi:MAG: hypothetical protein NC127_06780 [Muribaculum sp.]|nr:hypothetical protein [Muribaculum sp.]